MTTRRVSVLAVMIVCLAGVAVAQQDEAPLKNWTAPPYWTPPAPVKEGGPELQIQASAQGMTAHTQALPSSPLPFTAITPCRVADTRAGSGFAGQYGPPSLSPGNRDFTITGQCGIPSGAVAVSFNFHVIDMTTMGDLRTFPAGSTTPLVATMTWTGATVVISNGAVVPLGTGGAITVRLDGASTIDLIIDVNGYYGPQSVVTSVFTRMGDVVAAAGDYTASLVTNVPAGTISATDVQGALNGLDASKATLSHTHGATGITGLVSGGVVFGNASGNLGQNAGQLFWDQTNNRLGLGTITPNQQFELTGMMRMPMTAATSGTPTAGVLFLGGNPFLHNYGPANAYNTFVGTGAGNFTMGGLNSWEGKYNTASGYASLSSNTTGYYNTASGYISLSSNTTGGGNTASGYLNLSSNTTGSDNTASGSFSLNFNTTGYRNTAIGAGSLNVNTTGSANTASGAGSLQANTTGHDNTALGANAGLNLTTGSYNIDIGNAGVAAEANTIRIGTAGTQTRAFVAGIRGVTPGVSDGWAVIIDSNGQLGTSTSVGAVSSVFGRTGAVAAQAGDYTASLVTNVPAGTISATDVQGALNGLDASKATLSHTHGATGIVGLTSGGVLFGNASGNLGQNAGQFFWDQTNNRLGLGTITPNQQFELTGMMRMPMTAATTGTPTAGVLFLGTDSFLHNYAAPGSSGGNTFVGQQAGNFTMGSGNPNDGVHNTASGARSLLSNTLGNSNTANGWESLRSNTEGTGNTASGVWSLASNTTSGGNTASGYRTLNNSTGDGNTASGAWSLFGNSTGSINTASGLYSLYSNSTGSNNIAVGFKAGDALTTGDYNIDIANEGVAAEAQTIRIGTAGTQTRAFVAGIRGVTPGVSDGWAVIIDSNGQLGTSAGVGAVTSVFGRTGAVVATLGDYTALKVTNVPAGTISATDVQGALNGLDASKATLSHTHGATGIVGLTSGGVLFGNASGNLGQNAGQLFWDQTNNRLGIGTATPGYQLDLTGMVNMPATTTTSGTPTAGVLFLGTNPFLHNYGQPGPWGGSNTFVGQGAGNFTMGGSDAWDGTSNTAIGVGSLSSNTTGYQDTAIGAGSLSSNTTGYDNIATGVESLQANTTGYRNTASGHFSLQSNTEGSYNTASGNWSLYKNTTGSSNIAVGTSAGYNLTAGDYNIDVGNQGVADEANTIRIGDSNQTRTFIAGIGGVTTGNNDAQTVMIDSAGQLGTISSSLRFKQNVADMGDESSRLMELRPVTFRYKARPDGPRHFGLIAEEVEQVIPELVVRDATGQPETVAYHELPAMLLNELQKQRATIQAQQARIKAQQGQIEQLATRLAALEGKEANTR